MTFTAKTKTILALAIALVLLITSYFVLTRVILDKGEGQQPTTPITYTPPTLATGEYFSTLQGTLSMYTHSAVASVQSVQIYTGMTEDGAAGEQYKILRNDSNVLVLEGYEGLSLKSSVQTVFYGFCNPFTEKRITDGTETYTVVYGNGTTVVDAPLTQYGLAASDDPAWYELTLNDGTVHKVYVGYPTPLSDGYYCRYEGREEIYVLSATYGAVKEPKETYLTPTIIQTNSNSQLPYLDRFLLYRNGQVYVDVKYDASKYGNSLGDMLSVRFTANGAYDYIGNETLMNNIFSSYVSLQGNKVLKIIPRDWTEQERATLLPELLAEYGLSQKSEENPYSLVYGWNGITKEELEDAGIEGVEGDIDEMLIPVMFSEKSDQNTYNVYAIVLGSVKNEEGKYESVLYEQIVEVNASVFYYLESESVAFVRQSIYTNSVSNIGSLSFAGTYVDENGVTQSVNESFLLNHRDQVSLNSEDKAEITDVYSVRLQNKGTILEEGKTTNFAMLYALFMSNPQYFATVELTSAQKQALREKGPMATITLTEIARKTAAAGKVGALDTNEDGSVKIERTLTYTYYRYSSTLAIISLDGGETFGFAVSFAPLNELMENAARVANGQQVTVACSNQLASLPGIIGK